jgi:hypothetical protein
MTKVPYCIPFLRQRLVCNHFVLWTDTLPEDIKPLGILIRVIDLKISDHCMDCISYFSGRKTLCVDFTEFGLYLLERINCGT